jgi:hypothetical protein
MRLSKINLTYSKKTNLHVDVHDDDDDGHHPTLRSKKPQLTTEVTKYRKK